MNPIKKKKRNILVNNLYKRLRFPKKSLNDFFTFLDELESYNIPEGDLSIVFMNDARIARLHDEFMDDPSSTDVITFHGDLSINFAGEICASVDHAITLSHELGIPFNKELALYLIHGWLHLAGFFDKTDKQRAKMKTAEAYVLKAVEKARKLPDFSLLSSKSK